MNSFTIMWVAFICSFAFILLCWHLWIKFWWQPRITRVQRHHHELNDLGHMRDAERGDVRDDGEGESNPLPAPVRNIEHDIAWPSSGGPDFPRPLAHIHTRNRGCGHFDPVMGGTLLIREYDRDDDETQLIPAGAPLPRRESKRRGKGKSKARLSKVTEEEPDSDTETFSLSPLAGPRGGRRRGSGDLYLVPTPVTANRPRGRSITKRPVLSALLGRSAGPSRAIKLPDPSEFEIAPTTFWREDAPKVSRYRGLSATRPGQKPLPDSPPRPPPIEKDEEVQAPAAPPLPDPEVFVLGGHRPDSWEYFSDDSEDYNPDEWTSQVCSTVLDPRQSEAVRASSLAARLVGGDASVPAVATAAPGTNNNNNNKNNNPPAWELGGPTPDPRILMRKATLPGRQTRFVEGDLDDPPRAAAAARSPVEMTVFQECLELLREGAKTPPDIITELGVGWEEEEADKPPLFHGKTWSMSGALFQRRRGGRDGGEDSPKPKIIKSQTSRV